MGWEPLGAELGVCRGALENMVTWSTVLANTVRLDSNSDEGSTFLPKRPSILTSCPCESRGYRGGDCQHMFVQASLVPTADISRMEDHGGTISHTAILKHIAVGVRESSYSWPKITSLKF